MATRKNTFLLKRSNVAGNIPTAGQIQLGELALNTADVKLYASGTTTNSILPIGWDRISRTGDTMTGTLYVPTISATTYQNLPLDIRVTGGTYAGGIATFTNNTGGTFTVNGFSSSNTGLTPSNYVVQGKLNADQSIPINTDTVIQFIDDFDPQGWLNSSNYRFTPTIAGYYNITIEVLFANGAVTNNQYNTQMRKNGNQIGIYQNQITTSAGVSQGNSRIVYLNGTTDYIDFTVFNGNSSSVNLVKGSVDSSGTYFSASLLVGGNLLFTGGTISGPANAIAGFSANTISATTYYNLPTDVRVTGGTYSTGTATFRNNTGGTFTVTGLATQFTGGTVAGPTIFTGGVTANTISATTYQNLPNDLPTAGTTGQILAKNSNTNYDVTWIDNYADWTSQLKHIVKAGEAINKGQAVYVSSANGTNIIVSKASNTTEATSSKTLGLLAQDLALNGQGFVIAEGLLSGLNTGTATAGDPVWLGTNGNLIFGLLNKPVAPAHLVYLGVVTRVQTVNGEIFVRPQNGFEFNELHDVLLTGVTNGDLVSYDSVTSLWKNSKTLNGSYNVTGTITATTISATTYQNLPTDIRVTGGTYSTGTATFRNNTGGTFTVTGFNTGTVTAVNSGNGMNFTNFTTSGTITLGTPSSTTLASTNATTTNSHTHAFAPGGTAAQYITGAGTLVTFPTITTVNDGALTLATSGIATGSASFTANQAGASTFTVNVPATDLSIGSNTGTVVRVDSSTGTDATLPVATASLAGVVTNTTQSFAGVKTFNDNVNMANTADLKFVDLAGTFPTSGKGFDWELNNDGARIYAIQPSSDSIDLVFQLRDNATTNDRFVFHVDDYQGPAFDKYPLIIRGGTEFDLVSSALYTNGTVRLSNAGVLQNVTGNISMFTNDSGYLLSSRTLSINGTTYDLTANRSWVVPTVTANTINNSTYDLTISTSNGVNYTTNLGILATDVKVTGGTYNPTTGVVTFTNTTGGTFNVTGFSTGMTDTFVTGGTYSTGTATFTRSNGATFNVTGFNTGTVTAVNGGNGMNFTNFTTSGTITLGTPSSTTLASTNALTTNSHTHAFAPGGTAAQYITGAGTLVTFPTITNGTVTSVAALTLGTTGTDLNSTVANPTTTPVITLNVPNASATARGVITTGAQTIAGAKTFTSTLAGTNATLSQSSAVDTLNAYNGGTNGTAISGGAGDGIGAYFVNNSTTNPVVRLLGLSNTRLLEGRNNSDIATFSVTSAGIVSGSSFVRIGGTSAQFLKADGTVDSSTYVPTSRTITINGLSQDLSANRTWTVTGSAFTGGTVTGATNFTAGLTANTISATTVIANNFTGLASLATSATTALNATNVGVTNNTTTNATYYPTFVDGTSGNKPLQVDSSTLTFNPSTNTLTVANLAGTATSAVNATNASYIGVTDDATTNSNFYVTFANQTNTNSRLWTDSARFYFNPSTNTLTVDNLNGLASLATSATTALNATNATNATKIFTSNLPTTDVLSYPTFVTGYGGNRDLYVDSNTLTYNPSSNILTLVNVVATGTITATTISATTYQNLPNAGTVTAVNSGNGMNFTNFTTSGTITLGTPSSTTLASINALTTNSHTHAFAPGGTAAQYITGAGTLVTFPTIPTVNDGTLTLATSGIATGSASFTANQAGTSTFTVNVPATDLSIGVSSGTQVRMDSSTGADVDIPVASATLAGIVTTGAQTFAGTKTFNSTISGNITGNAGTASVATRVNMIDDASTNSDFPIVWADSTNTSARLYTDNARFTYNPASDLLRASRGVFSTSVDTNTLTANVLMTGPSVSATTVKGITISATTYLNLPSGGGGISGGGTVNFLPKFTGSTAVGNSLIYDNGTSVGIGMTTPSATAKLDVAGIIRSVLPDPTGIGGITAKLLSYVSSPYGLIFSGHVSGVHSIQNQREANAAQLYPLVFQPLGGNVGVGTLTPAKLLDVNGDALINGLTVGKGSTGVYNNVALGDQALASNTTGYNNVAIHSSLVTNTTGEFNVGIGYKSLFINTIGQRNIAVGNGALQLNIDGNYNTAIGNNVLYTNSNGSGNVAIGDNSLYLNTGGYNTAIGNDTLANNIGDVNLALGVGAGATLLNGSKNNIIGVNNTTLPDGNDLTYENYTLSISKENSNYKGLPQIWSPEQVIVYASTGVDIMVIEGEAYSSVFIDYVLEDDSGNMRAGVLKCVFNNGLGTIKWDENPTSDIGSTINYTFSFNNNGGNLLGVRLLNSGGNDVICNFTSRILLRAIF